MPVFSRTPMLQSKSQGQPVRTRRFTGSPVRHARIGRFELEFAGSATGSPVRLTEHSFLIRLTSYANRGMCARVWGGMCEMFVGYVRFSQKYSPHTLPISPNTPPIPPIYMPEAWAWAQGPGPMGPGPGPRAGRGGGGDGERDFGYGLIKKKERDMFLT